ncbi:uncharacterized protein NECHADRAFT_78290 [Fusarium vanettenii 77-13-4]|uniref:Uncharacterized protein n=1 Tax=Fusarium vanettenii (strain ATCC MYA-4622 / CBS 123669 / FGSC 9596 / NRRL 45880 / 77-13-4) TaxID=660122 RepID=C7ZL15_FUSV7|nr:uncharacterized protein NECHADRAFT_78290 [Fusarium vanettenii 77-13-4]EEU35297.1 predicted protein [Fusarium vanettenii 77-13-4]
MGVPLGLRVLGPWTWVRSVQGPLEVDKKGIRGLGLKGRQPSGGRRIRSRDEEKLRYNNIFKVNSSKVEVKQIRVGHVAKRIKDVERGIMTERSRLSHGPPGIPSVGTGCIQDHGGRTFG